MCIRHMVQVGKMTAGQAQALEARTAALDHIKSIRQQDSQRLLLRFSDTEDSIVEVYSFTTPETSYNVTVDWNNGLAGRFKKCTCDQFSKTGMICKHIALVTIAFPNVDFRPSHFREDRKTLGVRADSIALEPAKDVSEVEDVSELEVDQEPAPTVLSGFQELQSVVNSYIQRLNDADADKNIPNNDK
ncbi:hypothetical protein BGW42_007353, partial [Actinomortierella wolfii]